MEEQSRIKARLESLGELGELVNVLRSVAASRTREAQQAFEGTRAYKSVVERAIAEVSLLVPKSADRSPANAASGRALLVVTSENGFVGLLNSRLIDHALKLKEPDQDLVLVGRRGQIAASERGVANAITFPMTLRVQDVTPLARRIAVRLSGVAWAQAVHARHRPGADFDIVSTPILPMADISANPDGKLPVVHLAPDVLLARLASEYLFAEIAHTLMEALASENGARMRAMDLASRNIDGRIDDLRRDERIARQEKTTTEMLDVVIGAEAVNHH